MHCVTYITVISITEQSQLLRLWRENLLNTPYKSRSEGRVFLNDIYRAKREKC